MNQRSLKVNFWLWYVTTCICQGKCHFLVTETYFTGSWRMQTGGFIFSSAIILAVSEARLPFWDCHSLLSNWHSLLTWQLVDFSLHAYNSMFKDQSILLKLCYIVEFLISHWKRNSCLEARARFLNIINIDLGDQVALFGSCLECQMVFGGTPRVSSLGY